uniref:Uncharacterized protein n=1 Tax=Cacopsylla melanoneura TaxID=428564 RepID=A0A8D8T1E9_9HEMI
MRPIARHSCYLNRTDRSQDMTIQRPCRCRRSWSKRSEVYLNIDIYRCYHTPRNIKGVRPNKQRGIMNSSLEKVSFLYFYLICLKLWDYGNTYLVLTSTPVSVA